MQAERTAIRARPRRRTQAERREGTRRKILEAVVASIAEVGFQRTTATRIAARAGVTWGAVQHHYGGKDGILAAVLDDTFDRFVAHFGDLADAADLPLEVRSVRFVERAWRHFGSAHFRSTFEILLQALDRSAERDAGPGEQQLRMLESFDRLWRRVFPDAPLPRSRRIALESFTIATLMGLALQRAMAGGEAREPRAAIALLSRTLAEELGRGRCSGVGRMRTSLTEARAAR